MLMCGRVWTVSLFEPLKLRFVQNLSKVGAPLGPLSSVCITKVRCSMLVLIHFPFFLPGGEGVLHLSVFGISNRLLIFNSFAEEIQGR